MAFTSKKTVILTGASMGIGRALALELVKDGASVVLNARGEDKLRQVAQECRDAGGTAEYVAGDASETTTAKALVAKALDVRGSGELAGFIHAAGVLRPGPALWELSAQDFREVIDASVTGAFQLVKATVPVMRQRGSGLAVFFGSGAASIAQPGIAAYCIAKAAEEHLMRQLAAEAPEIATFAYQPYIVETRMQEQARSAEGESAEELRPKFREWKEKDELITPEQAAKGLMDFIGDDPYRWQGQVKRWSA
jgi:NAD(P)-dependent dehydrogenase (short-subunit alcohol dehydrogenase family)